MTDFPNPRILALFGGTVLFGQELGNMEALAALKERGCDVLCLIRNDSWSVAMAPALDARGLAWAKVPYIEQWQPGRIFWVLFRNPVAFLVANWRLLRIARQYRPTHIHAFNSLYTFNFAIALLLLRTPMVYRAGDEPTFHRWFWRLMWRFVVWRGDRFVANSRFVLRALTAHGVPERRITLIYNAPPARGRAAVPLSIEKRSGERFVTYVGQIAAHKGPHVLVDAFRAVAATFPEAHLLIAGRISEWRGDAWGRELRDRVARDPLIASRVTFLGQVDDVPALLQLTDIHVAPSLFDDPSPNVVAEAKQAGRPSIVFPKGGLPELVESGVDGLVCCEPSVHALTEALRTYLADPSLALRHGEAARASLHRLGVEAFGQNWVDVYNAAAARPT